MKNLVLLLLAVFLFGVILCLSDTHLCTADIPFSFIAEGKTYPSGNYEFRLSDSDAVVKIESLKPGHAGFVDVLTRLSSRDQPAIVFDVVGNDHFLSELYVPGMDGLAFKAAPAKHTHVTIKTKK